MKLAFCKHYKFRPDAILKLYKSVIRPKMEYAICTVSASSQFKELEKLQKRAIRFALQAKRNTPSVLLNEICNMKSIHIKLMEQQIKFWHKCKGCPENYLQRDTFLNWKKYIKTNDKNCIDDIGNIKLNGDTFNHVIKSPLSRCYRFMQTLYKPHQNILVEKEPSVMRPHQPYLIPFPTNIFLFVILMTP